MDYKKLHKNTLAALQQMVSEGKITEEIARSICADFVKECEDERIRKELIERFKWELKGAEDQDAAGGCSRQKDIAMFKRGLAWLEKQGETFAPIPLTPEILEKNGFVYNDMPFVQAWEQFGLSIFDNRIICGKNISMEVKYVHQLQQVLHLCGIDKEIIL